MPEFVEDGGAVPLAVTVDSTMTESDHVRRFTSWRPRTREPTVAVFHLSPASGRAAIATRIRLAESQIVLALAEMSDGSWIPVGRAVEVRCRRLRRRCRELEPRRQLSAIPA